MPAKLRPENFKFKPNDDIPDYDKADPSIAEADPYKFRIEDEVEVFGNKPVVFAVATDIDNWQTARIFQRAYHDNLDAVAPSPSETDPRHMVRLVYPDFPKRP